MGQTAQGCLLWLSISVIFGFLPGTFWGNSGDLDGTSPFVFIPPQLLIFSFKVTPTMDFFSSECRARSESWREDMRSFATFPWACRWCGGRKSSLTLLPTVEFLDCMSVWHITWQRDYCDRRNWGQPKLSRWACDTTRKKDAKELVSGWEEEDKINRGTVPRVCAVGVRHGYELLYACQYVYTHKIHYHTRK